ncbi:MAG: hypothetical protein O0V67_07935 [Methanocorpusculum sp.]|nr:hypothetical protein [Methanocorpusculum sp.]
MRGFFGDTFDFIHDGKLDGFEQAANFAAFASLIDYIDSTNSEAEDDENFELEMAGLDRD